MLSQDVNKKLASLQPKTAKELAHANKLAWETVDNSLLALRACCVDAALAQDAWHPPRSLSPREKAFIAFTEQFVSSVSTMDAQHVDQLLAFVSADEVYNFANALYVVEMTKRVQLVAGKVLP